MTPGELAGWTGVAMLIMLAVAIGDGVAWSMIQRRKKAKKKGGE